MKALRSSWVRVGAWSVRRPRRALGLWLAFVVGAVLFGVLTGTKTLDNGAVGESGRGYAIIDHQRLDGPPHEIAYVHAGPGAAEGAVRTAVGELAHRFSARGFDVGSAVTPNGRTGAISVAVPRPAVLAIVTRMIAAEQRARPALTVEQTGDISAQRAHDRVISRDLRRAELLSIPVTLAILLLAFGSVVAALVPLLLALSAVVAGLGLLGPISQIFPIADSAKTVTLLIGMAVGVDYALFYVVRSRAERRRGESLEQALATTMRTSGHTVVVSGTAVAIAMAGMFIAGVKSLNGLAAAAITVVACAVLGSVTVLPATLQLLGTKVDSGRIGLRRRGRAPRPPRFWPAVARRVLRRPLVAVTLSTAVLLALAYPALSLHVAKPSDLALTAQTEPELKALAEVRKAFPQASESVDVAVQAPQSSVSQLQGAVRAFRSQLTHIGVDPKTISVRTNAARTASLISFPLTGDGANHASRHMILELRKTLIPRTIGRVAGAEAAVTGQTADDVDFTTQTRKALPFVLAFVLALAFLVLAVSFRSLVVPIKAIVLNLLSVAASYGVLALVFEHHWAESLLQFKSNGTIVAWLPLFLFVVLFGLSMDYHVFILSRIREAVDAGESTEAAILAALTTTAGVVTAAAVVMVGVFALFGTLSTLDVKQAGVGLAVAVLLDATIIRAVLLPASMKLLGEWNWYLPFARQSVVPRPVRASEV